MSPPAISVVILCWKRREYLQGAVDSVLASFAEAGQDPEVLVVKGFEDPVLDAWLDEHRVRHSLNLEGPTGPKHLQGAREATRDVISWLDDDDLFLPSKIAAVQRAFGEDPSLAVLHNGHVRVDLQRHPLGPGPDIPDFSCSCLSIRREDALALGDSWLRVNGACDTLQYFGTLARGRRVRHRNDLCLTEYRAGPHNRSVNILAQYTQIAREISQLGTGPARRQALAHVLGEYFAALARTRAEDPGRAAWALTQLLRARSPQPFREHLREVVCGSLRIVAPPVGVWLYETLRRGDVDWIPPPLDPTHPT